MWRQGSFWLDNAALCRPNRFQKYLDHFCPFFYLFRTNCRFFRTFFIWKLGFRCTPITSFVIGLLFLGFSVKIFFLIFAKKLYLTLLLKFCPRNLTSSFIRDVLNENLVFLFQEKYLQFFDHCINCHFMEQQNTEISKNFVYCSWNKKFCSFYKLPNFELK